VTTPITSRSRKTKEPQPIHGSAAPRRDFLTLAEFLDALDVPKSTFFRWKAIGLAPKTYKLPNGQLRIRRTDFEAWMTTREEPAAA
jgi:predicted DNA-binding transcriptional regulator AlpA